MRLEIRYLNEFLYDDDARESHNLLRARPADTPTQVVHSYRVETTPTANVTSYLDYWGTHVDEFGIRAPHRHLRIMADSDVETTTPPTPDVQTPLAAYAEFRGDMPAYLLPSPHARWSAIARAGSAVEAVGSIADTVTSSLSYTPGSTFVGMEVGDVLALGKGVCQDFSHLAVAMYRSVGIPARYVSGYLYAADQTDAVAPEEPELAVQTHAWVEVFVPGFGWWGLDPTNPQPVSDLHVKIGHGRDYDDVMPLRGVYHGGSEHELGVSVHMSRERLSVARVDQ
jgi:transglutaminase-like putative cysteine protease